MAYRRKHGASKSSTFEDFRSASFSGGPAAAAPAAEEPSSLSSSLAAQAIRASAAHRDSSSLSSAYGESAFSSGYRDSSHLKSASFTTARGATKYEYTSMKSLNESKYGFWGVLARKAKSILEDDNTSQELEEPGRSRLHMVDTSTDGQLHESSRLSDGWRKTENPALNKGSDSITSSLHHLGGTIKNALEEGLTIMENRTADIIQETRKLQIRRKTGGSSLQSQAADPSVPNYLSPNEAEQETQLKASRDVANAMAAKAKLLLRELKTVKADLAFAKERCAQLEEENKLLRENREKKDNSEDDDLIRLQLETLLEEKGRLANENSTFARENRFLREIVEYHQLTMQDVVYLDDGLEDVDSEVCPIEISPHSSHCAPEMLSPIYSNPTSPTHPNHTPQSSLNNNEVASEAASPVAVISTPTSPSQGHNDAISVDTNVGSLQSSPKPEGLRRQRSSTPA